MGLFPKTVKNDTPSNYEEYKVGDIDPTTGKRIIFLAYQTSKFYVSIDSGYNLNWSASENMTYAEDFGEVVSQVSLTEALVDRIFKGAENETTWNVVKDNAERASATASTQKEAEKIAKQIAANNGGGEVRIHKPHGVPIRDRDTVAPAKDSFPPKDDKH